MRRGRGRLARPSKGHAPPTLRPTQASLVHTTETIRIRYFMDLLMAKSWPVMLVGNAGTGKSVLMGDKLESLSTDDYLVQAVPFNFYTTSAMLQGGPGRAAGWGCGAAGRGRGPGWALAVRPGHTSRHVAAPSTPHHTRTPRDLPAASPFPRPPMQCRRPTPFLPSPSSPPAGVLEKPLEKKSGRNYGPPGTKKLIYFIDDMNMPEVDKYGTVAPHTLIRQHMDHKHW